jgi:hypothetical protein
MKCCVGALDSLDIFVASEKKIIEGIKFFFNRNVYWFIGRSFEIIWLASEVI